MTFLGEMVLMILNHTRGFVYLLVFHKCLQAPRYYETFCCIKPNSSRLISCAVNYLADCLFGWLFCYVLHGWVGINRLQMQTIVHFNTTNDVADKNREERSRYLLR